MNRIRISVLLFALAFSVGQSIAQSAEDRWVDSVYNSQHRSGPQRRHAGHRFPRRHDGTAAKAGAAGRGCGELIHHVIDAFLCHRRLR